MTNTPLRSTPSVSPWLCLCLVLAACAAEPFAEIASTESPLYAEHDLWLPDTGRATTTIPVCFEGYSNPTVLPDLPYPPEWARVRDAIQQTWELETNIRFEGWSYCRAGARGIRVHMDPSNGNASELGFSSIDGVVGGLKLRTENTCVQDRPECLGLAWLDEDLDCFAHEGEDGVTADDIDACTRNTAVHEFGHALGLHHEQYRPDAPDACSQPADIEASTILDYDAASVMNYCGRPERNSNGIWDLSSADVKGIRTLYGAPNHFVRVGATVVFRATDGDFLEKDSADLTADGQEIARSTLFRLVGVNRLPGESLRYGDDVQVVHASTGRTVESTATGIRLVETPTAACTFRLIDPASLSPLQLDPRRANTAQILVNGPVALGYPHHGGYRPFAISGSALPTWRILGDFAPSGPTPQPGLVSDPIANR